MKDLFEEIDRSSGEYLELLSGLVRIAGVSPLPESAPELRRCAEAFADILRESGLKSRVYESGGSPVVYGETEQLPGRKTVLIYGHYDVQPAGDPAAWQSPPFEPELRDGRLYGRGVGDNKGQILAHVMAFRAYCRVRGLPDLNLKYLIEGEEEIGSVHLGDFVAAHKELLKVDVTIWSDGNVHFSGRPVVMLGMKGINPIKITVRGAASDVHSQWAPVLPSPVWELVRLLSSMRDGNGRVTIPGFYDGVDEGGEREAEAIRAIPSDVERSADFWKSPLFDRTVSSEEFFRRYLYEPTLNIGCISAGKPDGVKNIVPAEASVWMDMRLAPGQNGEERRKAFRDYVNSFGIPGLELSVYGADAAVTPMDDPFVRCTLDIIAERFGKEPIVYPSMGGSGPFSVFNCILGAPVVFVPFADSLQNDHAPNESVPVENLITGIKIAAEMLARFPKL